MSKILIVEHVHPAGEAILAREHELIFPVAQTAQAIVDCVADCDAILVRNTKITAEIMAAAARTRVIGRHGVGYDTIDIASATRLGIPVVYTPAANTESVAEIAMGFIILLGRKIMKAHCAMQSEELLSDSVSLSVMAQRRGLTNFDLWGKTLGIVGVGRIGTSLARKMGAAFHMNIMGVDPYLDAAALKERGAQKVERLEDMIPQCDFVSMHCPGGAGTRHLINASNLALFKPSAYLINTARGSVVDEVALAAALRSGQLAGAAVDVYDPEPPRPGNPLLHLDNAIVTPHFCAMTEESLYNMGTMVAQGILDVLNGQTPAYLVNPEVWPVRRQSS